MLPRSTALLLCVLCLLSGCSSSFTLFARNPLQRLSLVADDNANRTAAVQLDIVFVYEAAALEHLPKTAPQWFSQKAELLAGLGTALDVVALQAVPASQTDIALPARHRKAVSVLAYANYQQPAGQPVMQLDSQKTARLHLMEAAVRLEQ